MKNKKEEIINSNTPTYVQEDIANTFENSDNEALEFSAKLLIVLAVLALIAGTGAKIALHILNNNQ